MVPVLHSLRLREAACLLPLAEQRLHTLCGRISQIKRRAPQARRSSCCSAGGCGKGCDAERYHALVAEEAPYVKASVCSTKALHLQLAFSCTCNAPLRYICAAAAVQKDWNLSQ